MDDSSCDVLPSSAITTVSVADTQCAFRRISHGHVVDLLLPHVNDTFSGANNSPLVRLTQFHFFNCPPKTLVVISLQYELALCSSGKPEASSYSVMTGVNSFNLIRL